MGSESASELAKYFNTKKVFKDRRFRRRSTDLLVNWGNASEIPVFAGQGLNSPTAVAISSNKVATMDALAEASVNIPWFTVQREAAPLLFEQEGVTKVFCRTLTRASEGRGIVIANEPSEIVAAGLYTGLEPHTNEYRVHIMDGRVIDVAEKRRLSEERLAEENITFDPMIRSHHNGWIFARGNARLKHIDGVMKTDIATQALDAVRTIGLTFGAVDIIYNNPTRTAFVLEVNSAPGMEAGSTTLFNYVKAFSAKQGLPEVTREAFNLKYPDVENISEYPLITEFTNSLTYER